MVPQNVMCKGEYEDPISVTCEGGWGGLKELLYNGG